MINIDDKLGKRIQDNVENKGKSGNGKFYLNFEPFGKIELYKPEKDEYNLIDIIPYIVSTKNHPQGIAKGDPDYILDIWVHQGVGPNDDAYICPQRTFGQPCPICEDREQRIKNGAEWNDDEVKQLFPSRKAIYNVIDVDNEPGKIKIFIASYAYFEKEGLLDMVEDYAKKEEQIIFSSLSNGRSISFKATSNKLTLNKRKIEYLKYKQFSFEKRERPYNEKLIETSYSLDAMMVLASYEEIRDAFYMVPSVDDEDNTKETQDIKDKVENITSDPGIEEKEEIYQKALEDNKERDSSSDSGCPYNHILGVDCDKKKECETCDEETWTKCAKEQTSIRKKNRGR